MNYYKNDIKHNKGDTYSSGLVIEGLGQAVDTIYFTCRENLNDNAEILFQSGINNGISQVEYDEENDIRKYAIRVAPSKTKNLQSGTYYYDLEVGVNSDTFTIMKGKFILEQDATREDNEPEEPLIIVIKNSLDDINGETISVDIVEKLDYLEDTKSLMKDMINELGGELTDNDTFRSYVDEIYNIYPKAKGQGTNITLNNTKVAKMELEIVGSEESTNVLLQNKNLLNISDISAYSSNVMTIDEDGWITYTWNNNNYPYIRTNPLKILPSSNYIGVIEVESTTSDVGVSFSGSANGQFNGIAYTRCANSGIYFQNLTSKSDIATTYGVTLTCERKSADTTGTIKFRLSILNSIITTDTFTYTSHQEESITLPLSEGEYAYSYDDVTNITSTETVKATALMKGDE